MDEHDFSLRKCAVAMIFAFRRGFYGIIFHHGVKKLAEIVGNTKQFSNFVLGEFARIKRINFPVPMIHVPMIQVLRYLRNFSNTINKTNKKS